MKKFIIIILFAMLLMTSTAFAGNIPDITETIGDMTTKYPVRNNALVIVLQPVPDGSGDFILNICNKSSNCRQTSMEHNEVRYLGVFLEDTAETLLDELNNKKISTMEQWIERQSVFRDLYAYYMNLYDKAFGSLKILHEK